MIHELPFTALVSDVSGGNRKIKKSDYASSGKIPVIDQGKALVGGFTDNEDYLFHSTSLPVVVFGDHTCCVKHVSKPFAMGADGVKVLKPNEQCDSRYLYHYLKQVKLTDGGYDRHFKYLKRIRIPLPFNNGNPDLDAQKRIAAILDQADAIRRKRRQALQLTDDFLRSLFLDMFGDPVTNPKGWSETTVGDELDFLTSGSRGWAKYYSDTGDYFIRIQNLRKGELDLSDAAYVTAPRSAEAKRTKVQPGDVLLSITADLGRTAVVPGDFGNGFINQHLAILRFRDMHPVLVSHQIASRGGQNQFQSLNRSAVKAGLNFDDVRRIKLFNPPKNLQQKFADIVKRHREHVSKMNEAMASSTLAFASLQQSAFKGEI
jgi:type I restriction enzyme S subunit